jgi:hypothetical protein
MPFLHRERKEKLANAKRYATHVSKSNLSIEARQVGAGRAARHLLDNTGDLWCL